MSMTNGSIMANALTVELLNAKPNPKPKAKQSQSKGFAKAESEANRQSFLSYVFVRCSICPVWLQDEIPQKSTTCHNLRPEGADCAVCSQNWRANGCAFLCNMFDLHHVQSSRRYLDRKYFNRRMRFLFAKLVCAVILPFCCGAKWVYSRQNDGTHKASLANKKRILRLKYLRSK